MTDDEFDRALGARIRDTRRKKHMSQTEVAEAADIKQQQLYKFETGENRMRITQAIRIAAALDVRLSTLLGDLETKLTQ